MGKFIWLDKNINTCVWLFPVKLNFKNKSISSAKLGKALVFTILVLALRFFYKALVITVLILVLRFFYIYNFKINLANLD